MFLLARFCSDCNLQISRIALLLYVIVWGRWPFATWAVCVCVCGHEKDWAEDWTEVLRVVDHLLCWVGQNVLILIFTGIIPVWWPLGNLNLLFRVFFFFLRPAQKDLPGLAVFPCAVVGRETGRKSAAKATWAEQAWWDSNLLQCSVIPDYSVVCLHLFTYTSLPPSSFSSFFHLPHLFLSVLTWS